MILTLLLIVGAACVAAIGSSVIMSWASNRSALANMVLGSLLAIAVLVAALIIALLMTRATFSG